MTDDRERWALILGGSSGMGEATAITLAKAGYNICGIHLDFRAALAHVEEVKAAIEATGVRGALHQHERRRRREAGRRAGDAARALRPRRGRPAATPYVRVVMHSLAFGSLVPFLSEDPKGGVDRKKMEMTQDVMANSLVYWVQDLWRGGFLGQGSKIYAMTSEGSTRVVPSYGVVSSAKAALESHIRQLAMELARHGTGATANCIRAGVTITPALLKIPESQTMIDITMKRNPTGRMTTPQDVANAILALSGEGTELHQRRHHQRRRRRVHHGLVGPASRDERPGHRRRVGQRRPRRHDRAPARPRRDRHRRPVRAAPRRQGRQPGGRRGAARRADLLRRRGRRRRVRRRGARPRSRPRASTSTGC